MKKINEIIKRKKNKINRSEYVFNCTRLFIFVYILLNNI